MKQKQYANRKYEIMKPLNILGKRKQPEGNHSRTEYLIQWGDATKTKFILETWEPKSHLLKCPELVDKFENMQKRKRHIITRLHKEAFNKRRSTLSLGREDDAEKSFEGSFKKGDEPDHIIGIKLDDEGLRTNLTSQRTVKVKIHWMVKVRQNEDGSELEE